MDAANEDVVVKVDTQPIDGLAATTERDATVAAETGSADARSPDAGSPADAASTAPKFHVFLLLGQSNMAGYPKAQSGDKLKNPRIRVLGFDDCGATGRKANQWDVAVPPLHECWAGAIGPGDSFSQTLIEKLPSEDTIGLVPCALSGQAIEIFSKGTAKYDWIVERAQSAQRIGGVIEGFLFHQGESNCGNRAWPTKVKQLVSDLRTDLNLPNVPFIAGELPHDSACKVHNSLVNQLPTLIGNASVVSAQGLAIDSADSTKFHFSHDAQIELGKRYEAALIKALHW